MPGGRTRPRQEARLGETLQELEGDDWGEPAYDSHLVRRCHRLRRTPLRDFTVEDLRIMIGQGIGLPHLVPLAIAHLERDPLAEGDFYPGDLLRSVLHVPAGFWREHLELGRRIERVSARAVPMMEEADPTHRRLLDAVEQFATAAD